MICSPALRAGRVIVAWLTASSANASLRLIELRAALPEVAGQSIRVKLSEPSTGKEVLVQGKVGSRAPVDVEPGEWLIQPAESRFWFKEKRDWNGLEDVVMDVWPTDVVRADFPGVDRKAILPVNVRFEPSDRQAREPAGLAGCEISAGRLECRVPRGKLNLWIKREGFASIYRSSVSVPSNLGTLEFIAGSSLIGRVAAGRNVEEVPENVELLLVSRQSNVTRMKGANDLNPTLRTKSKTDGFFQFTSVPPGAYTLGTVASGLVSEIRDVSILEGTEASLLEPIFLEHPVSVDIAISPALDPTGKRWRVEIDPVGHSASRIIVDYSDEFGLLSHSGLSPGKYRISILDSANGVWREEQLVIEEDDYLPITIQTVRLRGTVKLGERPLASELTIRSDSPRIAIQMSSDEDGQFDGAFPFVSGAFLEADIVSHHPSISRTVRGVVPKWSESLNALTMEIRLADTWIEGLVLNEDGSPEPRATINVLHTNPNESLAQSSSADDGSFRIQGLLPGEVNLQAVGYRSETDKVTVRVAEGKGASDIRLILKPNRLLKGTLHYSGRPVPGADILAVAREGRSILTYPARTGDDGTFEIISPPGARDFDFLIKAPGFPLRLFNAYEPPQPFMINVSARGGTLILEIPPFGDEEGQHPMVQHGGGQTYLRTLMSRWNSRIEAHEVSERIRVIVPNVEPGEWTLCLAHHEQAAAIRRQPAGCSSGNLAPGGELVLRAP